MENRKPSLPQPFTGHFGAQWIIVLLAAGSSMLIAVFAAPQRVYADIYLVGTSTATGNSAAFNVSLTALAGGIGSVAQTRDLVIVVDAYSNTVNGNPGVGTAGFTELADLFQTDTNAVNFSVSYKIMGTTPDSAVSCNGSGTATLGAACFVYVWRGVDLTTPFDVASTTAVAASSPNANCPSITPVTSGAVVLCVAALASAAVPSAVTWPTTPAGIDGRTYTTIDPGSAITALGTYGRWTSGAYDTAAWTITAGTAAQDSWTALTVALRPMLPKRTIRLFEGYRIEISSSRVNIQQTP